MPAPIEGKQQDTVQSKRRQGDQLLVAANQASPPSGHSFVGFNLTKAEAAALPSFPASFPFQHCPLHLHGHVPLIGSGS